MKNITKLQTVIAPTMNPRVEVTATKVLTTIKASAHSAAASRSIRLSDDGQTVHVVDGDGREYFIPIHNVVSYEVAPAEAQASVDPEPPPAAPLRLAKGKKEAGGKAPPPPAAA